MSEYEIPFYAARFLTAYVSPRSLRNDRFPYTPASLWGKFKRNDAIDHASPRAPPIPANATPQAAEPAPFAFEPFTAPDKHLIGEHFARRVVKSQIDRALRRDHRPSAFLSEKHLSGWSM